MGSNPTRLVFLEEEKIRRYTYTEGRLCEYPGRRQTPTSQGGRPQMIL